MFNYNINNRYLTDSTSTVFQSVFPGFQGIETRVGKKINEGVNENGLTFLRQILHRDNGIQ